MENPTSIRIHFPLNRPSIKDPEGLSTYILPHVDEDSVIYCPEETYHTGPSGDTDIYVLAFKGESRLYFIRASVESKTHEVVCIEITL